MIGKCQKEQESNIDDDGCDRADSYGAILINGAEGGPAIDNGEKAKEKAGGENLQNRCGGDIMTSSEQKESEFGAKYE